MKLVILFTAMYIIGICGLKDSCPNINCFSDIRISNMPNVMKTVNALVNATYPNYLLNATTKWIKRLEDKSDIWVGYEIVQSLFHLAAITIFIIIHRQKCIAEKEAQRIENEIFKLKIALEQSKQLQQEVLIIIKDLKTSKQIISIFCFFFLIYLNLIIFFL
jgi:hypothetical protein